MIDRDPDPRRGDLDASTRSGSATQASPVRRAPAWAVRAGLLATLAGACGLAHATALLGGVIALNMAGGGSACAFNALVPLTTPQDTFALSGATPSLPLCGGRTMSADLKGDAATPSVGLKIAASGPLTTAAAQVSFVDEWIITPAAGTPTGLVMIPVTLSLDGLVAPGSVYAPAVGRYLDYTLAISDKSGFSNPLQVFRNDGQVTATGTFAQTWSGVLALYNYNAPALPMTAVVQLGLSVPNLLEGSIDFFNTASLSMQLPAGFTARTSSGLPLVFEPDDPVVVSVPAPGSAALVALGLLAIGGALRRRSR